MISACYAQTVGCAHKIKPGFKERVVIKQSGIEQQRKGTGSGGQHSNYMGSESTPGRVDGELCTSTSSIPSGSLLNE